MSVLHLFEGQTLRSFNVFVLDDHNTDLNEGRTFNLYFGFTFLSFEISKRYLASRNLTCGRVEFCDIIHEVLSRTLYFKLLHSTF